MQIRDLAWLAALEDHRHVTDTAAVLGTSQPTLSRALARVEAELGARLFERTAEGVHPTPAGALVVMAAREIASRHDQMLADLAGVLDPDSGVVRLAFLDSLATSLVPRLLQAFHAEAPRVRVVLRQEPSHDIVADVLSGGTDLAVTSPRPAESVAWLPLLEERLVLVVPPGHRLRGRRQVRPEELAGDELVTTPAEYGYRSVVEGLFREAGVPTPTVSFESQDLATIEGLVAAGLGVGIVPEHLVGASGTVGIRLVADGARRTVGLAWRADRELSPPARRLRDFVVGHDLAEAATRTVSPGGVGSRASAR